MQLRVRGGWGKGGSIEYYSAGFAQMFLAAVAKQTSFYTWLSL